MFGNNIDFFGTNAKRKKMATDFEKQQKIKVAREELKKKGQLKSDHDIFLDKKRVCERALNARIFPRRYRFPEPETALENLQGTSKDKIDPLLETIQNFIDHDRFDGIIRLKNTLTHKQKLAVEKIVAENEEILLERSMTEEELENRNKELEQDNTDEFSEEPPKSNENAL